MTRRVPLFAPFPCPGVFTPRGSRSGLLVSDPSGVGREVKEARKPLTSGPSWSGRVVSVLRFCSYLEILCYWASVTSTLGKAKAPVFLAAAGSQVLPLFPVIHSLPPAFSVEVPPPCQAAI